MVEVGQLEAWVGKMPSTETRDGDSHMKQTGIVIVLFWAVNFGHLVSLTKGDEGQHQGQHFKPSRSCLGLHVQKYRNINYVLVSFVGSQEG